MSMRLFGRVLGEENQHVFSSECHGCGCTKHRAAMGHNQHFIEMKPRVSALGGHSTVNINTVTTQPSPATQPVNNNSRISSSVRILGCSLLVATPTSRSVAGWPSSAPLQNTTVNGSFSGMVSLTKAQQKDAAH
jgi:hypothetical protein